MYTAENNNNPTDPYSYDPSLDVVALLSELGLSAPAATTTSQPMQPQQQYHSNTYNQATLIEPQPAVNTSPYISTDAMVNPDIYYHLCLEQQQQQQQQQQPYSDYHHHPAFEFMPAAAPLCSAPEAKVMMTTTTTTAAAAAAAAAAAVNRSITFATPIMIPPTGIPNQTVPVPNAFDGGRQSHHQLSRNNSRSSMSTSLTRTNSRGTNGGVGRTASTTTTLHMRSSRTSSYSSGSMTLYSDHKSHRCFIPGCYATFSRRRDMIRHLFGSVHSPLERAYKHVCDYCGKDYSRKDSLRRHQTRKHPEHVSRPSSTLRGTSAMDASAAAAAAV